MTPTERHRIEELAKELGEPDMTSLLRRIIREEAMPKRKSKKAAKKKKDFSFSEAADLRKSLMVKGFLI